MHQNTACRYIIDHIQYCTYASEHSLQYIIDHIQYCTYASEHTLQYIIDHIQYCTYASEHSLQYIIDHIQYCTYASEHSLQIQTHMREQGSVQVSPDEVHLSIYWFRVQNEISIVCAVKDMDSVCKGLLSGYVL